MNRASRGRPLRRGRRACRVAALLALLLCASTAGAQNYRFPMERPASGQQPYITAHRDNNDSAALEDYACGTDTYNGHKGTDIGIGGFPVMDDGSRVVVAAAAGTVVTAVDGCFDRCTSGECNCGDGFGNYVRIDHPDGKRTYYGHMKRDSLLVSAGDEVQCGTPLGRVGSSGFSTGPHLHFEVRHDNNVSDDPFAGDCGGPTSYWVAQGAYGDLPEDQCEGGAPPPPPAPSTGVLRGVVFEDKGVGTEDMTTRISGASVVVVDTNLSTTATGDGAEWIFDAPVGALTIRATAPGYEPAERSCDVTAGETTWCSIGLVLSRPPSEEPAPDPEEPEPEEPEPTPADPPDDLAPQVNTERVTILPAPSCTQLNGAATLFALLTMGIGWRRRSFR
jgi:murein DD-endopeptidase MepM/ murein hydrolase activator NlpD